jgi:hypothetical protein
MVLFALNPHREEPIPADSSTSAGSPGMNFESPGSSSSSDWSHSRGSNNCTANNDTNNHYTNNNIDGNDGLCNTGATVTSTSTTTDAKSSNSFPPGTTHELQCITDRTWQKKRTNFHLSSPESICSDSTANFSTDNLTTDNLTTDNFSTDNLPKTKAVRSSHHRVWILSDNSKNGTENNLLCASWKNIKRPQPLFYFPFHQSRMAGDWSGGVWILCPSSCGGDKGGMNNDGGLQFSLFCDLWYVTTDRDGPFKKKIRGGYPRDSKLVADNKGGVWMLIRYYLKFRMCKIIGD